MKNNKQSIPTSIFVLAGLFVLGLLTLVFWNFIQFSPVTPSILQATAIAPTEQYILENMAPNVMISVKEYSGNCGQYGDGPCPEKTVSIRSDQSVYLVKVQFFDQNGQEISYNCSTYHGPTTVDCFNTGGAAASIRPITKVCVNVKKDKLGGNLWYEEFQICD